MALDTHITDPQNKNRAIVDQDGSIIVKSVPIPTVSTRDDQFPLARYLTDNGQTSGSIEMNVDASVSSQEFYITSPQNADRYITTMLFSIFDNNEASVQLKNFGNINNGLTNGFNVYYETEQGEIAFQQGENIKTNYETIRMCGMYPAFGYSTYGFKLDQVVGQGGTALYGYAPILDVRKAFGFQWGLRLRQGAGQRLIVRINDDLTTVNQFRCYITGFDLII